MNLQQRGFLHGHLHVAIFSALATMPFMIGLPLVGDPRRPVALLAPTELFSAQWRLFVPR